MCTAAQAANCIIGYCNERGELICNLRLQKLLYYAQAWHLALYKKPLFRENFEAWVHGPVEPDTYRRFKKFGYNPIALKVKDTDFSPHLRKHIGNVMEVYGDFSALQLERYTHNEAPWVKARAGLAMDEPSTEIIKKADMQAFYGARLKR